MAGVDASAMWELVSSLQGLNGNGSSGSTEQATCTRVDNDGTVWVRLLGAETDTPVNGQRLADVVVGDNVTVTIEDGLLSVIGNSSRPSTSASHVEEVVGPVVQKVTEVVNVVADKASVGELQAATARIGELEADHVAVDDLTAVTGRIQSLESDHVSVADFQAEQANIDTLQANTADIDTIRANSAKVQNLTAAQLEADHATIGTLDTTYATIANLNAANGRITNLESTKANISDLEANYITADEIEATYMHANLSNSDVAWIENGTIKNGAIVSAMINDVSANKLTAGTINGSVINVTNLNADNITTGTINGQRIGEGSLSLSKLDESVYTEAEVNNIVDGLNDRIDGAIETFTGTAVPTLNNSPASGWNTTKLRDEHVGDVYYVVNSQSQQNGYCYRFTKSGSTYSWQLIKDSDVTAALQRISAAEGKITTFDSDISTLKTDTGTLTTRTTNLETRADDVDATLLDKVDVTTFNEVSDTVDAHTQTISQHTTAISNKADNSTVTAVTNRVSKNEQDISGINTTIGQLQTTVASKADGSTVTTISNKLNTVSDTVDGHTQTITSVQNTLSTKADSSTVSTLQSAISQNTAAIALRATKTEAYQSAQPNLTPYFSCNRSDSYWRNSTSDGTTSDWTFEQDGPDGKGGWAHFSVANTTSSALYLHAYISKDALGLKPSSKYTFLVEWASISMSGGTANVYLTTEHGSNGQNDDFFTTTTGTALSSGSGSKYISATTREGLEAACPNRIRTHVWVGAGITVSGYLRISLYEGEYSGPYKPYSGTQLYASQAELKVTNDSISTKVDKDGVISSINQSAESVTIDASKINLVGAVTIGDLASATQDVVLNSNVQVGGRNLLHGTSTMTAGDGRWDTSRTFRASGGTLSNVTTSGLPIRGVSGALRVTNTGSSAARIGFAQDRVEGLLTGETYTQGAWVRASTTINVYHQPIYKDADRFIRGATVSIGTDWTYISFTGTLTGTQATDFYSAGYMYANAVPANGWFEVCGIKLEKGNKATDWTPAPEDVDTDISEAAKTASNYITTIDTTNGIKIANANPSSATTYLQLASNFLDFIRGGVSMLKAWVDGTTAKIRVGSESGFNTLTDDEGIKLREGTDLAAQFTKDEITLCGGAGQIVAGTAGAISIIGSQPSLIGKTADDTSAAMFYVGTNNGTNYAGITAWSDTNTSAVNIQLYPVTDGLYSVPTISIQSDGGSGDFAVTDFINAIPVTLYDNASATASAAATLSESAANFKRLTIFYKDTDGNYSSTDVWSPNGKRVSLSLTWINGASTQDMYQRVRWVTISGTTISTYKGSGDSKYRTGQVKLGATASVVNSDYISIVHVIGYR